MLHDLLFQLLEACIADPPLENRYDGFYSKLLTYCFGFDSFDFFITRQSLPSTLPSSDTVDVVVLYILCDSHGRPVLITQVKNDDWVTKADLRFKADKQMRLGYDAKLLDNPIPCLWGLSLFGTSLRIYCGDVNNGDIKPAFEDHPNPSSVLPDDFLKAEWNVNILSQEGFDKMKAIVKDIVDGEAALQ